MRSSPNVARPLLVTFPLENELRRNKLDPVGGGRKADAISRNLKLCGSSALRLPCLVREMLKITACYEDVDERTT